MQLLIEESNEFFSVPVIDLLHDSGGLSNDKRTLVRYCLNQGILLKYAQCLTHCVARCAECLRRLLFAKGSPGLNVLRNMASLIECAVSSANVAGRSTLQIPSQVSECTPLPRSYSHLSLPNRNRVVWAAITIVQQYTVQIPFGVYHVVGNVSSALCIS
jgi:hypothetical protein